MNIGPVNGESKELKKQIWPLFVQALISGEGLLNSGAELVENLKYHRYDEPNLRTLLGDGILMDEKEKAAFLTNKLHFGDVLISNDRKNFLLCITPPCDIFRPGNIGMNVSYVAGERKNKDELPEKSKESQHISAYPSIDRDTGVSEIIYIIWHFYQSERFDLKDKGEFEKLCAYSREFRLDEHYARQIANKHLAYYSRAGVSELFVEENNMLRNIW
jgi:hypothetical protein